MILPALLLAAPSVPRAHVPSDVPSERAREVAAHARATYGDAVVDLLERLVAFRTVPGAEPGSAEAAQPVLMSFELKRVAGELGLDFRDDGAVAVIGLGEGPERVGLWTHGDVQPADASQWLDDPFVLERLASGRLVGRGVQDDKGPIAVALHAMKALADRGVPLARRIELNVSYHEESDWTPFREWLAAHPPPDVNVSLDAEYPVTVAEKGWCLVELRFPEARLDTVPRVPHIEWMRGGSFVSQVPQQASAAIAFADADLESRLLRAAREDGACLYHFERTSYQLVVHASGRSAHSSKPWEGTNALAHLGVLLAQVEWPEDVPRTAAWQVVHLIQDLIGTGWRGSAFGDLAHEDEVLGPLSLCLSTLGREDGELVARINLRRPTGRTAEQVEAAVRAAVDEWKGPHGADGLRLAVQIGEPYVAADAPAVPVLLDVFRHYADAPDARPAGIGGGTHARLLPGGVNFGPGMPGVPYTGHTEHEWTTRDQLLLDLEMLTAALVHLAGE